MTPLEEKLIVAAKSNDVDTFLSLIAQGVNINAQDAKGKTVLTYATLRNAKQLIEELISHCKELRLDIHIKDNLGLNPFMEMCRTYRPDIVKLVIEHSADLKLDINSKTNNGQTAFMLACWSNNLETIKLLIENSKRLKLDANAKNNYGQTVLFGVTDLAVMQILIQYKNVLGLDFNARNNEDVPLFEYVCLSKRPNSADMALLLMSYRLELDLDLDLEDITRMIEILSFKTDAETVGILAILRKYKEICEGGPYEKSIL
jgi:ankyrin repeat protein